jgi:hypothetical protein
MIKVYQFQLTDAEINAINSGEESEKFTAYFGRSFERTFKAENFKYYTHVANVDVDGFEQAFNVMNRWEDDENFDRLERLVPCSSMSVGDIVSDHDGTLYRCASFGFTAITA